jgi:cyanate permease
MRGGEGPTGRGAALGGLAAGILSALLLAGISFVDGAFAWGTTVAFGLWMTLAVAAFLYWLPRWRRRR